MISAILTAMITALALGTLLPQRVLRQGDYQGPSLKVYPSAVFAGHDIRLTCRVPRHTDNRMVTFGISNWIASEKQLNGQQSKVTFEVLLKEVPCEAGQAFCKVTTVDGSETLVTAAFVILGCEG